MRCELFIIRAKLLNFRQNLLRREIFIEKILAIDIELIFYREYLLIQRE